MKNFTLVSQLTLILLCFSIASWAQSTIFSEDFEGSGLPSGWSQVTNASDGGWKFGTNTQLQSSSFPITAHTKMACTNDDACNCDKSDDKLITPAIDLSSYTIVYMSFDNYYFEGSYQSATENATIDASTDGGTTWNQVVDLGANTGDWQTNTIDVSAYAGQSAVQFAFHYSDGGGWLYGWAIDNVSVFAPAEGVDLVVSDFTIGKLDPTPTFVPFQTYITNNPLQVTAKVTNGGTVTITSFDLTWTDGTNSHTQSLTGLNIAPLAEYDVAMTDNYVTLDGSHDITLTISNVNDGATELSTSNNTGSFSVEGVTPNPDRKYLAEEATGNWCGWCVRGIVFMDYMRDLYPDQFVGIAVHNTNSAYTYTDPMQNTTYNSNITSFPGFLGFPSVVINRLAIIDPSQLEQDFISNVASAPAVKVSGVATLNTGNNELTVTTQADFLQNLASGDYRFNVVLVEDSVHGTSGGYGQENYYSIADYGYAGPMEGFENMPGLVPASQMYFQFVGRELLGGFDGTSGSLPTSISSGSSYNYTYTFTVPAAYNTNHLHVVVMVIDNSSGEVLNVNNEPISLTTGIQNVPVNASLFIYPNPASQTAYLDLKVAKTEKVTARVLNNLGQVVLSKSFGTVTGNQTLGLAIQDLPTGLYNVEVTVGDQVINKKLEVVN